MLRKVTNIGSALYLTFSFPDFFFTRIQKRMPKSIVEFELKNGLISHELLSHLEKLSNLKRFVFRYAGKRELSREWEPLWEFELPDPQFVATRVESLALILDRENSDEITNLKCMIGPGLKHFGVHVAPRCYQWFVEEVMVELGVHNVQLDTCQLVFANPRMPIHLITSMVHSISERTQVMHVVCMEKANVQLTHYLKPAIIIEFNGKNEKLLKALQEKCPQIFQKAEILEVYNLSEEGFGYLVSALEKCYSLRELTISCDPKKFHRFLIDPALKVLPYSIQHLTLTYCYFSAVSIVYLTAQLAKSLQSLVLKQNSNFYNEKNFSELLRGMTELRNFEIDMRISPLSFPKIAAHRNLERFVAIPEGKPTEKALQVVSWKCAPLRKISSFQLRFKFQNVTIHETERRRFVLDVSNRRPVKLTDKR